MSSRLKSPKRLGRGLRDISHCFLPPPGNDPTDLRNRRIVSVPRQHVIVIVDDRYPLYSAALTLGLGRCFSLRGAETLLMDGVRKFPRLPYALKTLAPGIVLSHFLGSGDSLDQGLFQLGPGLNCLLPHFSLQDFQKIEPERRRSIFHGTLQRPRGYDCVLLRLPMHEETLAICPLASAVILLVPKVVQEMSQTYQRMKQMISVTRSGAAGIAILGAKSRLEAYEAWEKFQGGMVRFLDAAPPFLGYVPPIEDSGALLIDGQKDSLAITEIADNILRRREDALVGLEHPGSDFFRDLETLVQGEEMSSDEKAYFS